ncbi:MAG: hypothetical protein QME25_06935 [Bacteroidota bacterium]|nr:hypothetical protein [Bacteroidota bacterium]
MALSVGDVFWCKNPEFPDKNPHPHFVIAITKNKRIVYVWASTQIEKVEYYCQKVEKKFTKKLKTCIYTDPKKCATLDKPGAINCNRAKVDSEDNIKKFEDFKLSKEKAPAKLINDIKVGILCSFNTSIGIRNIFAGKEESEIISANK